jgi:hypothetical protein
MFYCRRCEWSGLLDRDVNILRCPDCKSDKVNTTRDPFAPKRIKKNWKKPRKPETKIKNMGLQILVLEDSSRSASKGFRKCNTTKY